MPEIKVKPCPFCGSKDVRMVYYDTNEYYINDTDEEEDFGVFSPFIRCCNCDIELYVPTAIEPIIPEIIKTWNRRTKNDTEQNQTNSDITDHNDFT